MNEALRQNLPDPVEGRFTDRMWEAMVDRLGLVFSLTEERKSAVRDNAVMKLTGALPYLAGCERPDRTALAHLSVYMLAALPGGKDVFAHDFRDNADLFRRLERISHFDGGDARIIRRGMNQLALAMLSDHVHDADEDQRIGKYNPVKAGEWDAAELTGSLLKENEAVDCPRMDEIAGDMTTFGFWTR